MSRQISADGFRMYGPGKFTTMLDAHIWDVSMDGCDDECGDVSTIGCWYGRMAGPFETTDPDMTPAERNLLTKSVGVIVSEDGNGFVSVDYFDTMAELDAEWTRIMDECNAAEEDEG